MIAKLSSELNGRCPYFLLRGVFGNDFFQFGFDGGDVEGANELDEFVKVGVQVGRFDAVVRLQDHNLVVPRRDDVLALGDQLLVELLPGTQTAENDLDVLHRLSYQCPHV